MTIVIVSIWLLYTQAVDPEDTQSHYGRALHRPGDTSLLTRSRLASAEQFHYRSHVEDGAMNRFWLLAVV